MLALALSRRKSSESTVTLFTTHLWKRSRLIMCTTGSERNSKRLAMNGGHPQAEDVAVAGLFKNSGCIANIIGSSCQHLALFSSSHLAVTDLDFTNFVVVTGSINYYTALNLTKVSLARPTWRGSDTSTLHATRCARFLRDNQH